MRVYLSAQTQKLFSAKTLKIAVGPVLTNGALVREHVRIPASSPACRNHG